MTEERAKEIMDKVIYENVDIMSLMKDSVNAFYVGRVVGRMERQLEIELELEIEEEEEEEDEDTDFDY